MTFVKCENCGQPTDKTPAKLKRYKHHFCSTQCRDIFYHKVSAPKNYSQKAFGILNPAELKNWLR
jgi:hypothetical protein